MSFNLLPILIHTSGQKKLPVNGLYAPVLSSVQKADLFIQQMCIEPYYMADTSLGTRDRMVRNTGRVFLHLRISQWLPIVLRLKAYCQGLQGPT